MSRADIRLRRAYEPAGRGEGYRVLVDRLWPRGVAKTDLGFDAWPKELAPSTELRKWFGHEPARWREFQARYFAELEAHEGAVRELLLRVRRGRVTLLYAARDPEHNHAVALGTYLRARAAGRRPRVTPA